MKIQIKTIASDYNENTGLSSVTISTDLGEFTGYSKLHPEDIEIASKYAGCRYAEMRAGIKYMKAKARIAKYKLEPLKRIYNNLNQMNSFNNNNNKGIKMLEKEIYLLEDEIETFIMNTKTLQERLDKAINSRPDIIKDIKKRRQDSE